MRYTNKLLTLLFAAVLLVGASVIPASAQRVSGRNIYKRPVVRYYYVRDPFWSWHSWYGWNDPYFYDPYLRERRTRYYKEKDVRDKRKDLAKAERKYNEDGYLSEKEQRKLAKAERKYNEALNDLRDYNNDE